MRTICLTGLVFLLLLSFFAKCKRGNKTISNITESKDTIISENIQIERKAKVILLTEFEVGKDELFLKNNNEFVTAFPQFVFLHDNEIYMLNLEREVNIYNIIENRSYSLTGINEIINNEYENNGISGFFVNGDTIFIGLSCKKIVLFSKSDEKKIEEFNNFPSCYENFSVFKNNEIFAFNASQLFKIHDNKNIPTAIPIKTIIPQVLIMFNDTLAVSNGWGPTIRLFSKKSKGESNVISFGEGDSELVRFCGISKSFYMWLNSKKNGFWLKNKYNDEKTSILFEKDFLEYPRDVPMEDTRDGIRVLVKNDSEFYFIIMKESFVQIYYVTVND